MIGNTIKKVEDYNEVWRAFPHSYAERMSQNSAEKWIAYDYLKLVSVKIAQMVAQGGGKLIVEMPPRHGKSTLISKWVPIWFLDLMPNKRIILATYSASFAAEWGGKAKNEIQNNEEIKINISKDSSASSKWNVAGKTGGMSTAGIGGPLTGKGADLLIIDDPVKNWEEASSETYRKRNKDWMKTTARTRVEPGGVIIVLQTRWHEDDLAGSLQSENKDYEVISISALAEENDILGRKVGAALCPERYTKKDLEDILKEIGSKFFSALYRQRPSPEEGDIFKRSWWQYYDELPEGTTDWINSWDFAFKDTKNSDYVCGFVMCRKGANIYIVDRTKEKLSFSKSVKAVNTMKTKWPKTDRILVEDKANGSAILDTLKEHIQGLIAVEPKGGKEARALAVQPLVEAANVYLPRPEKVFWVGDFIEECSMFPNGKHDDQVDAFSQGAVRLKVKKVDNIAPLAILKSSMWSV